ncbi:MAG: hypothetical protein AAFV53_15980 [Myxococcota bacterium]
MSRRFTIIAFSVFAVGCSTAGSYEGQFVMQMGATLPAEMKILAKAEPAASDLTCMAFEAPLNPDGTFTLNGLCKDTTYRITLSEGNLLMEGLDTLTGGTPSEGVVTTNLWPGPLGDGVAMLNKDGTLKRLSTYTAVQTAKMLDDGPTIIYPQHRPNGQVTIEEGQHLVIHGKKAIERMNFSPIIADTNDREFDGFTLTPHVYVGVKFTDDGVETVAASMNTEKVTDLTAGDGHQVRYISHDAFDSGHYALYGEGDRKMYVITFGPQPEQAAASNQ